jgi:hypothetical protein
MLLVAGRAVTGDQAAQIRLTRRWNRTPFRFTETT